MNNQHVDPGSEAVGLPAVGIPAPASGSDEEPDDEWLALLLAGWESPVESIASLLVPRAGAAPLALPAFLWFFGHEAVNELAGRPPVPPMPAENSTSGTDNNQHNT